MSLELTGLHGSLLCAAGVACSITALAYRRLKLKHFEIKRPLLRVMAACAAYIIACVATPHGRLIPLPNIDFNETPVELIESIMRISALHNSAISMMVCAAGLTVYYASGPVTEKCIMKMDEVLMKDDEKGARLLRLREHLQGKSFLTFIIILTSFVAFWPTNWLLSFTYTIAKYDEIELTTDHLYWAVLTFALAKTISALIHYLSHPTKLFSNGVHLWIHLCWFYGTTLAAGAAVFWAVAQDVLLVYMYKAAMLIQHQQGPDIILVDGIPKHFNVFTGPMADFLLEGVFSHKRGSALITLLHEQLKLYEKVIDDSLWIVLLWVTVLFPFCKVVAVYFTLRGKNTE